MNYMKPLLSLLILCISIVPLCAQDSLDVRLISSFPVDDAREIFYQEDYLFIFHYNGVIVVDVSDPLNPDIVYELDITIHQATIQNQTFLILQRSRLLSFDITDPTSPDSSGYYNVGNNINYASLLDVSGDIACISGSLGNHAVLEILDISNPDSIQSISSTEFNTRHNWRRMQIYDDYVYIFDTDRIINIIDISDIDNPFLATEFDDNRTIHSFDISNDKLYMVCNEPENIRIYDILEDPSDPDFLGEFESDWEPNSIAVSNGTACLNDNRNIHFYDISIPDEISESGHYYTPLYRWDNKKPVLHDSLLFIAGYDPANDYENSIYILHHGSFPLLSQSPGRIYLMSTGDTLFQTIDTLYNVGTQDLEIEIENVMWDTHEPSPDNCEPFITNLIPPGEFGVLNLNISPNAFEPDALVSGYILLNSNIPHGLSDTVWINPYGPVYTSYPGYIEFQYYIWEGYGNEMHRCYSNTIYNAGSETLRLEFSEIEHSEESADLPLVVAEYDTLLEPGQSTDISLYFLEGDPGEPTDYLGIIRVFTNDPMTPVSTIELYGVGRYNGIDVQNKDELPSDFVFESPYPNPFNMSITIPFQLKHSENITLKIFDILGREIYLLRRGITNPGRHLEFWSGQTHVGAIATSGSYIVRIEYSKGYSSRRITLVK
ncbi:MAG: T9SS type A sorting domain-containing protein [Candidatus Electryonea clarkiae]|nr:T9SS type A sorting domain-containing protein [Candidatus Electryonea clarkiae]MDP8285523.1 T9SS type A sorting domain-containing protein [Candidatus Electryonea clarkiae]